ncbi:hypothetical protein FCH28_15090 [Streptomyces piniterrae]|uniref:Uncharacterized protein n=1 Tax=Streptomyces piniterrae TaxID=2571125 RepID=A0A4U0NJL8_9ACTN|nr:hypothetical protein [Streptomyces piniterrae]TJZ54447.1 hypothetical protein FCH28_15090 [Streptomyces piniterrae]
MRLRTTLFAVALTTAALLGGAGTAAADGFPLMGHRNSGPGEGGARAPVQDGPIAAELDPTPGAVVSRLLGMSP